MHSEILSELFDRFEEAAWYDNEDRDIAEDILLQLDKELLYQEEETD